MSGGALRSIAGDMDEAIVAAIDGELDRIVRAEKVAIPLAIESGSRAWGFPSPDSDYDCRFVYVRPLRDYASLYPARDVIETPPHPVLDVNGWDLAKALRLMVKGNAVIIEWLTSPIVYRGDAAFRERMTGIAAAIADRHLVAEHYRRLALRQRERLPADMSDWPVKKLFYMLRPAAALRWLRLRPEEAVAPMHFPTLCSQSALPVAEASEIDALLRMKARTREMGHGGAPPRLLAFIDAELAAAAEWIDDAARPRESARRVADDFFWEELKRRG